MLDKVNPHGSLRSPVRIEVGMPCYAPYVSMEDGM